MGSRGADPPHQPDTEGVEMFREDQASEPAAGRTKATTVP
jgi:hypothetical protein